MHMVGVGCTDTCVYALVCAAAWLVAACAVMQVAAQVMRLLQADGHFEHEHGSKHEAQKGRAVGGDTGHPGTEEAYPTARAIRKTRSSRRRCDNIHTRDVATSATEQSGGNLYRIVSQIGELHSCSALDFLEEDRAIDLPIAHAREVPTPTRLDEKNQRPDGSDMREQTREQRRRRSPPPTRESSGNRPSLTPSQARALRQHRKGYVYIPK